MRSNIAEALEAIASNKKASDSNKEIRCYYARELAKEAGVTKIDLLNAIGVEYAETYVPDVPAKYQVERLIKKHQNESEWQ